LVIPAFLIVFDFCQSGLHQLHDIRSGELDLLDAAHRPLVVQVRQPLATAALEHRLPVLQLLAQMHQNLHVEGQLAH
jgi:hypothetical protein